MNIIEFANYLLKSHLGTHLIEANQYFLFESATDDTMHVKIWSEENDRELASPSILFGILRLKRTKSYDDTLSFIFGFRWVSKLDRRKINNIDRFLSYFNEKVTKTHQKGPIRPFRRTPIKTENLENGLYELFSRSLF